jgi:polyhydroxyalkanoate synthesis regulator phasin
MDKDLRKLILLGIGIGAYTKDAVEKEVTKIIKKNKISVNEAKHVAKEFYADLATYRKDAEAKMAEVEKKLKSKLNKVKRGKKK